MRVSAPPGTETAEPGRRLEWPRRSTRVELVGPMQGMSYSDRKWLICLDGSQYVQATELLYHLLQHADGKTSLDEIASLVTAETGRAVSGEEIRWLVLNKLASSGLIEWPDTDRRPTAGREAPAATETGVRAPSQIMAIKHRFPLLPYWLTAPATAILEQLYWPPLIVCVVLAAVAINIWIYRGADFVNGVVTLFFQPELVLFLFAVDTVTRIFHELGHASALRRAGARHGDIGFALYVIFPVYYTDVTHSYRLNRLQRIRVDLGGIYFDLISMIGLYVVYRFTGYTPLLLMITLIALGILRQFTPFMRFDGYYLIADLMGVPEPMSLLVPFVKDRLFWRRGRRRSLEGLRPMALAILSGYLLLIVAFLSRPFLLLGIAGGAALQQLPRSGTAVVTQFLFAWRNHDVLTQVAATLELVFWALIPIGLGLFAFGLLRAVVRGSVILAALAIRRLRTPAVARAVEPLPAPAPKPSWSAPTPLDGLGRPIESRIDSAIAEIEARAAVSSDGSLRELVEDLGTAYRRRLGLLSEELERMARWSAGMERERDALDAEVRSLQRTVAQLGADVRRLRAARYESDEPARRGVAGAR